MGILFLKYWTVTSHLTKDLWPAQHQIFHFISFRKMTKEVTYREQSNSTKYVVTNAVNFNLSMPTCWIDKRNKKQKKPLLILLWEKGVLGVKYSCAHLSSNNPTHRHVLNTVLILKLG